VISEDFPGGCRILLLSPAFLPLGNPEAYCSAKLARVLLQSGAEVIVVTQKLRGRTGYDYGGDWSEPWNGLRPNVLEVDDDPRPSAWSALADRVGAIGRARSAVDGVRWAVRAASIASKVHRERRVDLVLSRGFPLSAHLAARIFSRDSGVPWIANWNDPWEYLRRPARLGFGWNCGFRTVLEARSIARCADWNTFPSEILRRVMTATLGPRTEARSSVIPHAAVKDLGVLVGLPPPVTELRLAYVGRLSRSQPARALLDAMVQWSAQTTCRIVLTFAGFDEWGLSRCAVERGLEGQVLCLGPVSYMSALHLCAASNVLVVIDPPGTRGMLCTSKLSDYVATDRPILALGTPGGTLEALMRWPGAGAFADGSQSSSVLRALTKVHEMCHERASGPQPATTGLYRAFAKEEVVGRLRAIFRFLAAGGSIGTRGGDGAYGEATRAWWDDPGRTGPGSIRTSRSVAWCEPDPSQSSRRRGS